MSLKIDGPVSGPISLSVGTTPVLAVTGSFPAGVRRKYVRIQALDEDIYWGYDNTVSASTGFLVGEENIYAIPVGAEVDIYLVAESGTVDVRVSEEG